MTEYQRMLVAALQGNAPAPQAGGQDDGWGSVMARIPQGQMSPRAMMGGAFTQALPQAQQPIPPGLNNALNGMVGR